jgi:hypothetical protein
MTTCELCNKTIRLGETVQGIKYGSLVSGGFRPAQDSAATVLCSACGEKVCRMVYASLDNRKLAYPVIFRMVTELTGLMKNGYKVIQAIAALPTKEQSALHRLIIACKENK